jgi:cellulose synthase/poly-beta-1,6-N-acetylglucosamine synthase-like glycosyltransferase
MEVKTVEDTRISVTDVVTYASITAVLLAVVCLPTVVYDWYPRLLNTFLLVGVVGLAGRSVLAAVLSFRRPSTPELDCDDDDLPPVSVVIPAYNEEPVLPDTIAACKAVDYPAEKLEVVLCYEADSTDRTGEICEAAAAEDERFVAVRRDEPGGGKAKAVNYGLRYASHDIIASIDADHKFEESAIRKAVAWFRSDEDIWCIKGRCFGDNPDDSILALHATVERHIAEKADLFARDVIGGFTIFGGGQAFFRRAVFDELGDFDEEVLVEDIDMSAKIHDAGKTLRMDPSIITYEENPPTLSAWWSQRKRWARGWMQVAVRYLPVLPRSKNVSTTAKLDSIYTFCYAIVPAALVLTVPLTLFSFAPTLSTLTYIPYSQAIWTFLAAAPVLVTGLVFAQDYRDGHSHQPREYLAAFTLWFYLVAQTVVFVTAFIEEFVLDKESVYVTTSRSELPADD